MKEFCKGKKEDGGFEFKRLLMGPAYIKNAGAFGQQNWERAIIKIRKYRIAIIQFDDN